MATANVFCYDNAAVLIFAAADLIVSHWLGAGLTGLGKSQTQIKPIVGGVNNNRRKPTPWPVAHLTGKYQYCLQMTAHMKKKNNWRY